MKILLIKNNRLYSYILPREVKDNYWITDIDSFDNIRNLINVEADKGKWVLVSNYDTHIIDASSMYERFALSEYHFYSIKNDSESSIIQYNFCGPPMIVLDKKYTFSMPKNNNVDGKDMPMNYDAFPKFYDPNDMMNQQFMPMMTY